MELVESAIQNDVMSVVLPLEDIFILVPVIRFNIKIFAVPRVLLCKARLAYPQSTISLLLIRTITVEMINL